MSDWQKGMIPIATYDPISSLKGTVEFVEKEGEILNKIFGVFRTNNNEWNLTHCPTGLMVSCFKTKTIAKTIAEELLAIENINWKSKTLKKLTRKNNKLIDDIFTDHGLAWRMREVV